MSTDRVLEPRLLSIKQAAAYSNSTTWFMRTQIWAGAIPYLKLGKRYLIDRADLDLFIDQRKQLAA